MKKFYPFFFLLLPSLFQSFFATAQQPYNVIFIVVDDLNIQYDAFGQPDAKMPNFARLTQHGMWFTTTYCQYGVCNPSRTSFLSGKRPDATGVYGNLQKMRTVLGNSYKFLPEYFHAYGYRTERFGKASCDHEEELSWDYFFEARKPHFGVKGTPYWFIDTLAETSLETIYGVQTDTMIKHLRHPVKTPYFYTLGISSHNPFTPPLSDWNKNGDSTVLELLPVDIEGTKTNVYGNGSDNITLPNTPPDDTKDIPKIALGGLVEYPDSEWKRIKHGFYGEITETDNLLGLVLDELDDKNLWSSSVIVFVSDNGINMGEHKGVWLKGSIFEEALRLPFVICAPGKKTGICTAPVEAVDMYPTLAELCNLPKPDSMEGSSLVPLLENPTITWKKAVFAQISATTDFFARAVRTSQYHYNDWGPDGEELYDIINDPYEYTNLATDPGHLTVLNNMRNLKSGGWQNALPPVYTKSTFYKDGDGDGYGSNTDSVIAYFAPDNYVAAKGDCNDSDNKIYPGAIEICDGLDNNCNNKIDEDKPVAAITANGSLDICATGSVQLQAGTGTGYTYQWTRNGVNISGATDSVYTATKKGRYRVGITSTITNCQALSNGLKVTKSCEPIAANASGQSSAVAASSMTSIYPNPAKDKITVKFYSNTSSAVELRITDLNGKTLFDKKITAIAGENTFNINISHFASGNYFLQLITDKENKNLKFIIEK